jgi:hypothetical protein
MLGSAGPWPGGRVTVWLRVAVAPAIVFQISESAGLKQARYVLSLHFVQPPQGARGIRTCPAAGMPERPAGLAGPGPGS